MIKTFVTMGQIFLFGGEVIMGICELTQNILKYGLNAKLSKVLVRPESFNFSNYLNVSFI